MHLMTAKCRAQGRMMGCAFVYAIEEEGLVFVRLLEDRSRVDVVVVSSRGEHALAEVSCFVLERALAATRDCSLQVTDISRLLGQGFAAEKNVQMLCPHCCSSDMFVRSAAVHVFERVEVENSSTLHCSRYHEMPSSDVCDGCSVKFNLETMPLLFPGVVERLQGLEWSVVDGGGVLGACADDGAATPPGGDPVLRSFSEGGEVAASADPAAIRRARWAGELDGGDQPQSHEARSEGYGAGTFLAMSFFVETGQVDAGDCLHSDELQRFRSLVAECGHASAETHVHTVRLRDGREKSLQFRFKVGDAPASPGGRKIASIHAADVGDGLAEAPSLGSFSSLDNVLVVFEKSSSDKKNEFKVFAGCRNNLRLCRLTPSTCSTSPHVARCWSELQDYFAIVMGPEFQNYEITALTLFRNDERARAFVQHMSDMQLRRREAAPPWEDRGRVAGREVAALGGGQFARYGTIFERGDFDWARARTSSDEQVKKELQRVGVSKEHADKVVKCVRRLQHTFDSQEATMRHFKDHSGKFGLLPADKNEDVNLTLAWWGNWRGNAV
jgi:hypothetical protein